MAGFLLVAGLTGGLLAWLDELEVLITPQLRLAAPPSRGALPLDPLHLHEAVQAQLWGLQMKILVSAMGVAVAMLSVTGIVVWARKRRARPVRTGNLPAEVDMSCG